MKKNKPLSQEDAERYSDRFNFICEQLERTDLDPMLRAVWEQSKEELVKDFKAITKASQAESSTSTSPRMHFSLPYGTPSTRRVYDFQVVNPAPLELDDQKLKKMRLTARDIVLMRKLMIGIGIDLFTSTDS